MKSLRPISIAARLSLVLRLTIYVTPINKSFPFSYYIRYENRTRTKFVVFVHFRLFDKNKTREALMDDSNRLPSLPPFCRISRDATVSKVRPKISKAIEIKEALKRASYRESSLFSAPWLFTLVPTHDRRHRFKSSISHQRFPQVPFAFSALLNPQTADWPEAHPVQPNEIISRLGIFLPPAPDGRLCLQSGMS